MTMHSTAPAAPYGAASPPKAPDIVLSDDDLNVIVSGSGAIFVNGTRLELTGFERKFFLCLATRQGTLVTNETLHEELYGGTPNRSNLASLKVFVSNIRKKLDYIEPNGRRLIRRIGQKGLRMGPVLLESPSELARITHNDAVIRISAGFEVFVDDRPLALTTMEARLLSLLAAKSGIVQTTPMVMQHLYGRPVEVDDKIVDVYICKINTKYEALGCQGRLVQTVWGRGHYVGDLVPDPDADASALPVAGKKVKGPEKRITSEDLFDCSPSLRWTVRLKATIVALVEQGVVPLPYVLAKYPGLSTEEYREWVRIVSSYGLSGLRVTRRKDYASVH